MRIQQFIKKLNNTELGKGTTHEYYVLVPSDVDIEKMFDKQNRNPSFFDIVSKKIKNDLAQLTIGRESRIKGLGPYYRENKVCAGDEIIFERRDYNNKIEFLVNLNIKHNIITFQKNTKGFLVLNFDRLSKKLRKGKYELQTFYGDKLYEVIIQFKESSHKRSDSPEITDFYEIIIDNKNILNDFKNNEYIELEESSDQNTIKKVTVWQKYEFQF